MIQIRVRLQHPEPARAVRHLAAAVLASTMVHGAVLATVVAYGGGTPGGEKTGGRVYHVQILQLTKPLYWPDRPMSEGSRRGAGAGARRVPALSSGPQTLVVNGASREVRLRAAIPLPTIVSRTQTLPLPARTEPVRPDPEPQLRAIQMLNPSAPPVVSIISLPEVLRAPDATPIPAVSQAPDPGSSKVNASAPGGSLPGHDPSAGEPLLPDKTRGVAEASGAREKLARIELPRNGKPEISVFGESIAEQYPETEKGMRGLAVSTLYLKMGLRKNWILEYWAPSAQKAQDESGRAAGLEAPWPYVMLRPEVMFPPGADAVLVRGALTVEGRLERLQMLLPVEWAQMDDLFRALRQWEFRPALLSGQPQAVEGLLVIPRQPEE